MLTECPLLKGHKGQLEKVFTGKIWNNLNISNGLQLVEKLGIHKFIELLTKSSMKM